jgi:hypothetical protein
MAKNDKIRKIFELHALKVNDQQYDQIKRWADDEEFVETVHRHKTIQSISNRMRKVTSLKRETNNPTKKAKLNRELITLTGKKFFAEMNHPGLGGPLGMLSYQLCELEAMDTLGRLKEPEDKIQLRNDRLKLAAKYFFVGLKLIRILKGIPDDQPVLSNVVPGSM